MLFVTVYSWSWYSSTQNNVDSRSTYLEVKNEPLSSVSSVCLSSCDSSHITANNRAVVKSHNLRRKVLKSAHAWIGSQMQRYQNRCHVIQFIRSCEESGSCVSDQMEACCCCYRLAREKCITVVNSTCYKGLYKDFNDRIWSNGAYFKWSEYLLRAHLLKFICLAPLGPKQMNFVWVPLFIFLLHNLPWQWFPNFGVTHFWFLTNNKM